MKPRSIVSTSQGRRKPISDGEFVLQRRADSVHAEAWWRDSRSNLNRWELQSIGLQDAQVPILVPSQHVRKYELLLTEILDSKLCTID